MQIGGNMDELYRLVDAHPVISFDVFDTLLKRPLARPVDLFRLMEEQDEVPTGFARVRIRAERQARREMPHTEVDIDEIYTVLARTYDAEQAERLKELELKMELQLATPHQPYIDAFHYALAQHKRVFIISDMYLHGEQIAAMLTKLGVTGYEALYASCDYRLTKADHGALYRRLLADRGIEAADMLHIGDSRQADIAMAQEVGLATWQVHDCAVRLPHNSTWGLSRSERWHYDQMRRMMSYRIPAEASRAFQYGYELFGPLLQYFLTWLRRRCAEEKVTKILCCSRDGYIIKEALKSAGGVPCSYFYISRRSVIVPLLRDDASLEAVFHWYLSWPKYITMAVLLDHVGLEAGDYAEALEAAGLDLTTDYTRDELLHDAKVRAFYASIQPDIQRNAMEQYEYFATYLRAIIPDGARMALVDLGGNGTIGRALVAFLREVGLRCEILPLYVVSSNVNVSSKAKCIDDSYKSLKNSAQLRLCNMLIEMFFSAPHGTVLSYRRQAEQIIPCMAAWEYDHDAYRRDRCVLEDLHAGALQFVADAALYSGVVTLKQNTALRSFLHFGMFPMGADVEFWRDFHWYADEFQTLVPQFTRRDYVFHPLQMYKDWYKALWAGGYLQELFACNIGNWFIYGLLLIYRFTKGCKG